MCDAVTSAGSLCGRRGSRRAHDLTVCVTPRWADRVGVLIVGRA